MELFDALAINTQFAVCIMVKWKVLSKNEVIRESNSMASEKCTSAPSTYVEFDDNW